MMDLEPTFFAHPTLSHQILPDPIVIPYVGVTQASQPNAYLSAVSQIEALSGLAERYSGRGEITVFTEPVNLEDLTIISEGSTWGNLLAMLVLTFPEIQWEVMVRDDVHHRSFVALSDREPLFDACGLRQLVIEQTNKHLGESVRIPARRQAICAIDDESDYCFLHGYTAYRYGYRSEIVYTWHLMRELVAQQEFELVLEDVRLQFPDKPQHVRLSNLQEREHQIGPLKGRPLGRFLITSGQDTSLSDLMPTNEAFLEEGAKNNLWARSGLLTKPLGGILDVWMDVGPEEDKSCLELGVRQGNVKGFQWPPRFNLTPGDDPESSAESSGHGTPGKLALVGGELQRRAAHSLANATTSISCLQAAVLAGDSSEIFGGRNPTSTLTSIALRHEAEVKAECSFMGAGYHIEVQRRIEEIRRECVAISEWFSKHEESALNAQVAIFNRLAIIFRQAGQFDEENSCLIALRRANRKLQIRCSTKKLDVLLVHLPLLYAEWLLVDIRRLFYISALWVLLIGALDHFTNKRKEHQWEDSLSMSLSTFFGGSGAPAHARTATHLVVALGVAAGVFHLGILISYLYSLVLRK